MPAKSREDLERLMKLLTHHRMYPSGDWNATANRLYPGDERTRLLFREYMSMATEADRRAKE